MLSTIFLWFFIYSVLGWAYETIGASFRARRFVNRGMLNGPYCPIYGFGACLVILLFSNIENLVVLFLLSSLATCSLEYFASYLLEKLFHVRWWDYSNHKMNINGRVCLLGAVGFGTLSVIIIKFIHPIIGGLIAQIPPMIRNLAALICFGIIASDTFFTVRALTDFHQKMEEFSHKMAELNESARQHHREQSETFQKNHEDLVKKLSHQHHRLMMAFPRLKLPNHHDNPQETHRTLTAETDHPDAGKADSSAAKQPDQESDTPDPANSSENTTP